jgi:hypothetical protein
LIKISGPSNEPIYIYIPAIKDLSSAKFEDNFFYCEARTLGEALEAYCAKFDSEIQPYDGSVSNLPLEEGEKKYFFYLDPNSRFQKLLVDIHVIRDETIDICPKQNLDFKLESGDKVSIGMLVC